MRFEIPATLGMACLFLVVLAGQDVPDSTRRVFSRGIIPVSQPEETVVPVPPELLPPVGPNAAEKLPPIELPPADMDVGDPRVREPGNSTSTPEVADISETAWRYFDGAYRPTTGWFDSVKGYTYATMWDISSGLAAVACAEQLKIIPPARADELLRTALSTLRKIPLYNDELPNREYNTETAAISGPKAVAGRGTGWSALDLGRLLIWLRIITIWHPEYATLTREIVQRWKFGRLARGGEMFGVYYSGSAEQLRQEGRLGYEQYSASGYSLWGLPMEKARGYSETRPVQVLGVDLTVDKRNLPYLTSEAFLLAAFELGVVDKTYSALRANLYLAQQRRWERTHEITAASEDSQDRLPWFAYFNISYQGEAWSCRSFSGAALPDGCGFSTKAAFGWAALFDDAYSQLLEETARPLASAGGYLAGTYASGGRNTVLNINTNAVILEAMLYRQRGRRAFLETIE